MKNLLSVSASIVSATILLGTGSTLAQNTFNGYQGYYSDLDDRKVPTGYPAQRSYLAAPGSAITDYEYIEGPHYRSPYAGNNAGEWSYGKDADSPCYHGNYGYNGQTTNYDPSKCVVVYDAQTYVRLLRGSSSMGGTQFFGTNGYNGTDDFDMGYPSATYYTNQRHINRNTAYNLQPSPFPSGNNGRQTTQATPGSYAAQAGGQRQRASGRNASTGDSPHGSEGAGGRAGSRDP
ncbi:MAG: hypothetical protein QM492_00180 [Rhodobacterales bacterium]